MRARRDWTRLGAEVLGALVACANAPPTAGPDVLALFAHIPRAVAWRVYVVRSEGDPLVIGWWREGRLSFSQLWACIGYAPASVDGGRAQRAEAIATSADVRRVAEDP